MKIYKIIDNTNGNVYIGKTKKRLCDRMAGHRYDYRNNGYCSSREIIKNGDYKIELIEETEDESRERYWIENTECINKNIPGRTDVECKKNWRDNNRDKQKQWRKDNKDKIQKWREDNKDLVAEYDKIRTRWYTSMGGRPDNNNMSLLKIDPNLFLI